jgi:hypothetical protein
MSGRYDHVWLPYPQANEPSPSLQSCSLPQMPCERDHTLRPQYVGVESPPTKPFLTLRGINKQSDREASSPFLYFFADSFHFRD